MVSNVAGGKERKRLITACIVVFVRLHDRMSVPLHQKSTTKYSHFKKVTIMADNNKKNSFWEGVKKGAGCAIGAGLVVGAIGFCVGGPVGAAAGFKLGAGAGALGGGMG